MPAAYSVFLMYELTTAYTYICFWLLWSTGCGGWGDKYWMHAPQRYCCCAKTEDGLSDGGVLFLFVYHEIVSGARLCLK